LAGMNFVSLICGDDLLGLLSMSSIPSPSVGNGVSSSESMSSDASSSSLGVGSARRMMSLVPPRPLPRPRPLPLPRPLPRPRVVDTLFIELSRVSGAVLSGGRPRFLGGSSTSGVSLSNSRFCPRVALGSPS
jgi:hypothetical protein